MLPYFTANQGKQLEEKVKTVEGVADKVGDKLDNVTRIEQGLVFLDDNVYFGENVAVDGDLNLNGEAINFNGATISTEDSRLCAKETIPAVDVWKVVADAYSSSTLLAQGITVANVVSNGWNDGGTVAPPGGEAIQGGQIMYVVGFVGKMIVLCLGAGANVHYWYADASQTTLELKINTGTYTVIKDTYAGYTEGEEGQKYHKFGYVEEVEFQGKGIGPGQAGVTVDTVVEDKLYVITINIGQIPEEYHFPTNIEGTILEIYSESQSNWYKPMWTYYNNETGYLKQFAFFFQCDPDGEDICKFRILK